MQSDTENYLTGANLDRLSSFLKQTLAGSSLAEVIPDGAHIFHGSFEDDVLTNANLKLASKTLLAMTLGYVDEAPLIMIYEHKPSQQTLLDLSGQKQKLQAQTFVETFQKQSQRDMTSKINELQIV